MTTQEQLKQASYEYAKYRDDSGRDERSFQAGGLKGMEIQKEIDRQEIERLKQKIVDLEFFIRITS